MKSKRLKTKTEGKMELIHEDLTRELIGCFFPAHNSLGVGCDEPTYHKALERRFLKKGIDHRSNEHNILFHRGRKVREDEADFISYLRALNLKIGIIANFGKNDLEIRGIRA
jgi:hypothetical protein